LQNERPVRPLDRTDPWTGASLAIPVSGRRRAAIDAIDPWDGSKIAVDPNIHGRPWRVLDTDDPWLPEESSSLDESPSHRALREAMNTSLAAGDFERAAELRRALRDMSRPR
jgi:hypothetical protein